MQWETVIGLEVHAQLSTQSKIFSGAPTAFGAPPNAQACAVDIALPGVLPVLNKAAVEKAIRFGLAVEAMINRRSVFARKNYFYPDLPKGYQISQYELPIVQGGQLLIEIDGVKKTVRLTRAHLEEDAGKSIHGEALSGVVGYAVAGYARADVPIVSDSLDLGTVSGIDLNRAGTPLLEIVSEPDMRSAEEAVAYAEALHFLVVEEISICDGNMEEGSFRFDANVSVRRKGSDKLGTRCEIKNLNSFRFLEHAIEFEAKRQIEILEDGGAIVQETRLYDSEKDETRSMRTKEEAHDYRYFPDPDLLPLLVSDECIEQIKASMPESLRAQHNKIVAYGLSVQQANQLTASRETSTFALSTFKGAPKEEVPNLANWILGPLRAKLNEENLSFSQTKVSQDQLRALSKRVSDGKISNTTATGVVLPAMWKAGHLDLAESPLPLRSQADVEADVDRMIEDMGLKQISDLGELEKIVDKIIAVNPDQVADYRAGKAKAFNFLVGQAMKASGGKANPQQLNEILKRKLSG
jgi:aspartyl-tRNA(Asn)/glutamyl-tRNA(Gln) amidotransferase subunit B